MSAPRAVPSVVIRLSRGSDLEVLSAIEKAADAAFLEVGLALIADADAPDPTSYAASHRAGRLLVATSADQTVLGFVRLEIVDGRAHIEQVSVHPDHSRQGVGAALLSAAERWAVSAGYCQMTLTTYREVPWNGPYYSRLGWAAVADEACGPELAAVRQHEVALGLDALPRQAMVKTLTRPASSRALSTASSEGELPATALWSPTR